MFCLQCGKEIENTSVQCPYCGAEVQRTTPTAQEKTGSQGVLAIVFGALGMLLAWVIALLGYACGAAGLSMGLMALKKKDKIKGVIGIVLSSITFLFSVINSILGVILMTGSMM